VRQSLAGESAQKAPLIAGPNSQGVVAVTVPLENAIQEATTSESLKFLRDLRWTLLALVSVAAASALLVGTLLFRQITRPLTELQTSALKLGRGDLEVRVPIRTQDEVGQVGQAFNEMADQLENLQRSRRRMIADIAHELRTPLSVIRSNMEAMLDGLIEPEAQELVDVHEEILRLTRLTEDLRLLSLVDAGQVSLSRVPVDAGDLIEATIRQMMPFAEKREVVLEGDIRGVSAVLIGDPDRLKQAVINLVDNGLRFTPVGGHVFVKARQAPGELKIMVIDGGPGIPPADQAYVFERFWRGDTSRSREAGGTGLGLAIVKEIVTLHDGKVELDSPPGGPCTFTISLPI
jgi:signal transduction histidine kinase